MNNKLILWSITVGLGGLLFGLDTAVISGAEQVIQKLWQLSDLQHGLAMSIALVGTIFGSMFGGIPADKFGRKNTLIWVGILFFVSALGSALAPEVYTFMLMRFIGGLSIGASSVVAPVYISEIAPPQYRGRLGISFQANIVFGILVAYVCNYLLQGTGENDWRWMLGIVAAPSLAFSVLMMFTPETPRWLYVYKHDEAAARAVLSITQDAQGIDNEIDAMKNAANETNETENIFSKKFRYLLLLAFLFSMFNQLSGINAVIYFAPRIFKEAGFEADAAFLQTTGIGAVNMAFTILGWYLIDRFGRRSLMYIGSVGYIVSLLLIGFSFYTQSFGFMPLYIFAFIASHAIGQGSVIWIFISEIFPTSVRASGMAFGSLTHWIFATLLTFVFPFLVNTFGAMPIFFFFAFCMVFQLLYVWKMMPETKGVSLEDLQKRLLK